MKKLSALIIAFSALTTPIQLLAHCQMPCGIYHDDMVYDQVDQYVETMYKAMAELNSINLDTVKNQNTFVRWVFQKEKQSDEISKLILEYFLQQKIKPDEPDTAKKLELAHKMLFLIVGIKQNTDVAIIHQFMEVWDQFKHMFHREGYECKIETIKLKKWAEEAKELKEKQNQTNKDHGKASEQDTSHQDTETDKTDTDHAE
ncbi:MAG: hypothetical protein H7A37_09090 [Chlamydiales bacterium]|nr:hypothetical protein [Chlamydiia bacterium]MCP5508432.1 hypothetical protein [Chlamydiales bacterium]